MNANSLEKSEKDGAVNKEIQKGKWMIDDGGCLKKKWCEEGLNGAKASFVIYQLVSKFSVPLRASI